MALVIKKTVDLGSIGEEYEGIVLHFKSVPVVKLTELSEKEAAVKDDSGKIVNLYADVLAEYFIDGTQNGETLDKEDLKLLDAAGAVHCYGVLVGGSLDPKGENLSTSASSITEKNQEK